MSRKARPIEGDVCWFCKQPADTDSWMGLGFLKSTCEPVYEGNYILYHEPCAVYSNGAGDLPPDGMDDESVLRFWLHGERCSGIGLRCQLCGLKGATTGCLHGPCQQFYHFPCARVRAFQGHLQFSLQCRSLACSDHLHLLPMPVEEQHLGMWMEGGGSWNGTQHEEATAWLQHYSDNMRDFKKHWRHLLTMTPYEQLKAKEAKAGKKGKRRSDDNDPDFRAKKGGRSSNPGSRSRASQQQVPASPAAAGRMSDPGAGGSSTPSRQRAKQQKRQQRPSTVGVPPEIAQSAQEATATTTRGLAGVASFGAIADALRPSEDGSGMQQQHWRMQQQQQWPDLMAEEQMHDSPADADWQQQQQLERYEHGTQQQQQQPLDCDLLLQAAGFTTPRTSNQQLRDASGQSGPQTQPAAGTAAAAAGPPSAAGGVKGAGGGSRSELVDVKAEASSADSAPDGQGRAVAAAAAAADLGDAAAEFGTAAAGLPDKQQQQQYGGKPSDALQQQHDNQQQNVDHVLQASELPAAATGAVPSRLTAPLLHRLNSLAVAALSAAAESSECGGMSLSGGVFQGPLGTLDNNMQQSRRRKFLDVNEFLRSGRKLLSYDLGNTLPPAGDAAGTTAAFDNGMEAAAAAGGQLGNSQAQQPQMKPASQQQTDTHRTSTAGLSEQQRSRSAAEAAAAAAAAKAAAVLKSVSSSGGGGFAGAAGSVGYNDSAAAAHAADALPAGWQSKRGTDMLTWLKQKVQLQQQLQGQQQSERQQQQQQSPMLNAPALEAAADSSQALQAALKIMQTAAAANASAGASQKAPTRAAAAAAAPPAAASADRATSSSVVAAQKAAMEAAAAMAKIAADPDMDDAQRGQLLQNALKAARAYLQPHSSIEGQGFQRTADASSSRRSQAPYNTAQQQQHDLWQNGNSPLQSPRLQQQQQQRNGSAAAAAPTALLPSGMQALASPGSALTAALAGLANMAQSGGDFSSLAALSSPMAQQGEDMHKPKQLQATTTTGLGGSSSSTQKADLAALLAKLANLAQRTSSNQVTVAPAQAASAVAPAQQQQCARPAAVAAAVHRLMIGEYFGCVTSLPPLQAGELRVAGITAHPNVVAAYAKQDLRRALQLQPWSIVLPPAALRQLSAWGVPAHKLANDLYGLLHASNVLNNHLTNTSDSMANGLGGTAAAAAAAARQLQQQSSVQLSGGYAGMPQDFPARYVRGVLVGADDPRRELRGEFGLTATQDLSVGTILGPWRSYVLTGSDYVTLMSHVPADWQEPRGAPRQQAWLDLLHKFTLALKVPCLEGSDPYGSTTSSGQTLYFCALGYGNLTCLANDPIVDPWTPAQTTAPAAVDCKRIAPPNVDIVAVLVNGMPLPMMVTTKGVRNGEQLCYSYGRQYWQTWGELKRALQQQQQGGRQRVVGKM